MKSINSRMTNGIMWMMAARLADRSIGIVSTLVLARLLIPEDFGLVAMAMAISGMLDLLGAFSFDVALIQNTNATRKHYDTVWTLNAMFLFLIGTLLVAGAGSAAAFYHEPRLVTVIYVLSASYFFGAFSNVGVVNFRKNLDFKKEFVFIFAKRIITFLMTMAAALYFRSYWALLIGITVGRVVSLWMSYRMNAYRPRFSLAASRELFHFSKWLFLNNVLGFILNNGPTFIIGRVFGASGLGVYTISYEISNLPSTELVAPINRVTFSGFSKMADISLISASYLRLLGMITLLILPVGVGIAAVSAPMVLALLGEKWASTIPLISVLAINGAIAATQTNNISVWMAIGRPRDVTMMVAVFILILYPALYVCLDRYGIVGAGYAYLAAQAVNVPLGLSLTKRQLNFTWTKILSQIWRPIVACCLMYLAVWYAEALTSTLNVWIRLVSDVACGAATYCLGIMALWFVSARPAGAERFCMEKIKNLVIYGSRTEQP